LHASIIKNKKLNSAYDALLAMFALRSKRKIVWWRNELYDDYNSWTFLQKKIFL